MRGKFLFFLLVIFCSARSQNTFQRTYGKVPQDYAYSMEKTNDGGYIVAGSTNSYGGPNYLYLFKIDSIGDTSWVKGYAISTIIYGYSVQQTNDNGYVVAGNEGVIKTDATGNITWGFYSSGVQYYSVQQTSDGGYILAGSIGAAGSMEIYLLKLNAAGTKQWSRKLGGAADDIGNSIKQTSDGGYILLATTTSFGAGSADLYLLKTDLNGDTLWTKTYGGTGSESAATGRPALEITNDGGFIIAGFTSSFGVGGTDAYLIKTDANGDTLWTKTYGGAVSEIICSVKQTHDGGYIFAGYTTSFGAGQNDFYLVRTNSFGDTLWTRAFGGSNLDYGQSVVETNDKGFLMAGYTKSFGTGNNDVLLIKTDSLGNSLCGQYPTTTLVSSQPTIVGTTSTHKVFITLNLTVLNPVAKRGGSIIDICNSTSEISALGAENTYLNIFPNPNSGVFSFSVGQYHAGKIKLIITDILGEPIYNAFQENNTSIDLSQFSNGIYFIKAEADKIYTQRIIINK